MRRLVLALNISRDSGNDNGISVFIGVFGGLYFLYLLLTNKRV